MITDKEKAVLEGIRTLEADFYAEVLALVIMRLPVAIVDPFQVVIVPPAFEHIPALVAGAFDDLNKRAIDP